MQAIQTKEEIVELQIKLRPNTLMLVFGEDELLLQERILQGLVHIADGDMKQKLQAMLISIRGGEGALQ